MNLEQLLIVARRMGVISLHVTPFEVTIRMKVATPGGDIAPSPQGVVRLSGSGQNPLSSGVQGVPKAPDVEVEAVPDPEGLPPFPEDIETLPWVEKELTNE